MLFNSGVQYNDQSQRPRDHKNGNTVDVTVSDTAGTEVFKISGAQNLLIDGQGSTMMFGNSTVGLIELSSCSIIIVQNFAVDYSTLPYATGVITSISGKTFDMTLDLGSTSPTAANILNATQSWGYCLDPDTSGADPGRTKYDGPSNCTTATNSEGSHQISSLGNNSYQITVTNDATLLSVGDRYVLLGRYNGSSTFYGYHSSQLSFINDTIYAAPAAAFVGGLCSDFNEIDCQVLVKPGRYISTDGGGSDFQGGRIGPWVQGCTFQGMADDAFNYYSDGYEIQAVSPDNTTFTVAKLIGNSAGGTANINSTDFKVGDTVAFFDQNVSFSTPGLIFGTAQITVIDLTNQTITLNQAVTGVVTGTNGTNLYDLDAADGFVIQNNTFKTRIATAT